MFTLEVQRLSKTYGTESEPIRGFRDVSFGIRKGESLGLVGESGCGKTTLARTLLRLIPPDKGDIWFQGKPWLELQGRDLRRSRQRMQAVFQDPESSLNPMMSNRAIVEEPLKIHRLGDRRQRRLRIQDLLERVGLPEEAASRMPAQLSGGQKQRLALARALATNPALLIADEPISALDVSIQLQILELLSSLRQRQGLTILFISHSIGAARYFCDRIAVMRRGRLVELAPPSQLFAAARHPYTRFLIQTYQLAASIPPEEEREERNNGEWVQISPEHWVLEGQGSEG